jgi:hypothetical protein
MNIGYNSLRKVYTTKVSKGVSIGVYTQKYSTVASWATTIGSTEREPDDIIIKNSIQKVTGGYNILEPILEEKRIFLTIASGATTIGSAGRAPDDVYS